MNLDTLLNGFLEFEKRHTNTAYLYATLGNVSMAMMQVCAKLMRSHITTAHMLYLRSICLIVLNSVILYLTGHEFYPRTPNAFKLLAIRVVLSSSVVYMYFYPIDCISISIINALWMTVPVWTPLSEWLIIGAQVNKSAFVAILISFLGILLIIQPEFLFGKSGDANLYCCIIVLTAAFLNSFSMVILRLLKGLVTNDTALQYFYLGQIFANGLILVSEGDTDLHHQPVSWSLIGVMALLILFAYTAQVTITRAVFLVPASSVMPFNYVLVVTSFLIDVVGFHQQFSWLAIAGIIVVCLSLLYIIKYSHQPKKERSPAPSEDSVSVQ